MKLRNYFVFVVLLLTAVAAFGQKTDEKKPATNSQYDEKLAQKLGADEYGMKAYVMVILKTGPKTIEDAKERAEIFKGHFANMNRLATEGKLALAGPFDGKDGWRGMFIFNVAKIEEAKKLTETDPVIKSGIMIAEYHEWYGSAGVQQINELHKKLAKKEI